MTKKLHHGTRKALVSRGVPTNVIDKVEAKGDNVTTLDAAGKGRLIQVYGKEDGELLYNAVHRSPIPDEVVDELLSMSREGCCFCRDVISRPFQIHHIRPYSEAQDHSLDNLAVVCPTHHAAIHRDNTPADEQVEARDGWYALVRLWRAYEAEAVSFPFDAFEPIVFGFPVRPAQLLSGRQPSPSTCVALANSELGRKCGTILHERGRLVVFGGPGSGKSTLAVGVAGQVGDAGAVFRYRASSGASSRDALQEVLHFLKLAKTDSTLIIDDMNKWATVADLEKVLEAATQRKIVVVWSEPAEASDNVAAPHVVDVRVHVSWAAMSADVLAFIAEHEPELTPSVAASRGDGVWPRIGYGVLDRPLTQLARQHAKEVRNVWHLTYLLSGGGHRVQDELDRLAGLDLDFAPLVHVAVRQIAGFEQPTSAEEAAMACGVLFPEETESALIAWANRLFSDLHAKRVLLRARHGFITIHREWARAFICAALADPGCHDAAAQLIKAELGVGVDKPRRLGFLFSWLGNNSHGKMFLRVWAAGQMADFWKDVIAASIADGFVIASIIITTVEGVFRESRGLAAALTGALRSNMEGLKALFRTAAVEDWYRVKDLAFSLGRLDVDLLFELLKDVEPELLARRLEQTPPEYFHAVIWFLHSVRKARKELCAETGRCIDWGKFVAFVQSKIQSGDAKGVEELAELASQLDLPLRRSSLDQYGACLKVALHGALPSNLRVTPVEAMPYMELWPACLEPAVGELDPAAWARDLVLSDPQAWRRVLIVCGWAARAGFSFARELANAIDLPALVANVRKKAPDPIDLLCLLPVLSQASEAKRKDFGVAFAPFVSDLLPREARLLQELAGLDLASAQQLAEVAGTSIVEPEEFFRPLREKLSEETRAKVDELEESGDDFDVGAFWMSLSDRGDSAKDDLEVGGPAT